MIDSAFSLPPDAEEALRNVSQTAAAAMTSQLEGNGFKAAQVRLVKHDTQIYKIPAAITVTLTPELKRTKGRTPPAPGAAFDSEEQVLQDAQALAVRLLENDDVRRTIQETLKQEKGEGFGIEPATFPLTSFQKEYAVQAPCPRCQGTSAIACTRCMATGRVACQTCRGEGYEQCRTCYGTGMYQPSGGGERVSCTRCQRTGRVPCRTCNGSPQLNCPACNGQGNTGCSECARTGIVTTLCTVTQMAECQFDIDWRETSDEARQMFAKLGKQAEAAAHLKVFWQPPTMHGDKLVLPCLGFLAVSEAEFTLEGKSYPATVAGVKGRVIKIDPLLDPAVKPGIGALQKFARNPLAGAALIETACKYRLLRDVLAGLARGTKGKVYHRLVQDYPAILSDKYARAAVHYASLALEAMTQGPRTRGLLIGTAAAAALAGVHYFMLRNMLLPFLGARFIGLADMAVWLAGGGITFLLIQRFTAAALEKWLPSDVRGTVKAPSVGWQGFAGFATSGLACALVYAAAQPGGFMQLLK